MEIKEFAIKVCDAVKGALGEEYGAELKEVTKNNGIVLHGLMIFSGENNVIPTLYLDSFWEAYEAGMPFAAVMNRLLTVYREDTPKENVNMEFFRLFHRVRDRICYRLIGRDRNEELLKRIPHIEFLDMAICFYYAYHGEALGDGTILIHNSHMDMWKVGTADLLRLAQQNTPRLFPWDCSSMEAVLEELTGFDSAGELSGEEQGFLREIPMKVLSNDKKVHGAACLLYPGVLEKLAGEACAGLYILPSSIHEVILMADNGRVRAGELRKMIAEVNDSIVAPEEVLSDNLYYYDLKERRIRIIF